MHFIRENLKPLFMEQHHGQLLPAFNIWEQTILFLLPTLECSKANLRQNLVHLWVFQKVSAVGYYIFHVSGLFTELQPPEKHMNHKWPWLILVFIPAFVTCEQYASCATGSFLLASSSGALTSQGLTHPCSHTADSPALAVRLLCVKSHSDSHILFERFHLCGHCNHVDK